MSSSTPTPTTTVPTPNPSELLLQETLARITTLISLRSIIALNIHNLIPPSGSLPLSALSAATGATEELLTRLFRPLLSASVFACPQPEHYAHTPLSLGFRDRRLRAAFTHGFDETLPAFVATPAWLAATGWRSPSDPRDTPFAATHGGDSLFEHLTKHPAKAEVFAADNEYGFEGVVGLYPFDDVAEKELRRKKEGGGDDDDDDDDGVIVDVGGGKGQAIRELVRAHPGLKGKIVLQDMESVLRGVPEDVRAVVRELRPYDFFQEQPIKGAAIYYLRRILCDWPDASCQKILRNQFQAMRRHSRLLVAALVVPEHGLDPVTAASDAAMMTFGGKERTENEFRELFSSVGLSLVKVWSRPGELHSILEARIDGN